MFADRVAALAMYNVLERSSPLPGTAVTAICGGVLPDSQPCGPLPKRWMF